MADQQELHLQTMAHLRLHLGLVERLLRFLRTELTNHTLERDDHEAHEYLTTIHYSPEHGALLPVWHCNYCKLLFTYAKVYNQRLNVLYGQMRQLDPLGIPPRTDRTEMTHYLRPPFPQIPPDDLLEIIETATQWHPMPGPPTDAPPQPEPEQLVHEPPTTDVLTPNLDE
jgi:hypothetical protein